MFWDLLFTYKRSRNFVKNIILNILGVLEPVQINAIHQIVIFSPITNGNVIFNDKILKRFNQVMATEKVWNVTNSFLIPNGVEEELFKFQANLFIHQIGSWRWKSDQPKFSIILFLYKYHNLIVSLSWQLGMVFKTQSGGLDLNKIVHSGWKSSKMDISIFFLKTEVVGVKQLLNPNSFCAWKNKSGSNICRPPWS